MVKRILVVAAFLLVATAGVANAQTPPPAYPPANISPVAGETTPSPDGPEVLGNTVAGGLPTTGSANTMPLTQVAIAAVAGGGLLVLLANRRRAANADTRETAGV